MRPLYIQRYLLTGLLTFIPIWLTWAVFKFIFSLLSQVNLPLVAALFSALAEAFPETIGRLNQGWLVSLVRVRRHRRRAVHRRAGPRAMCSAGA